MKAFAEPLESTTLCGSSKWKIFTFEGRHETSRRVAVPRGGINS
jgi:hypothetical protein